MEPLLEALTLGFGGEGLTEEELEKRRKRKRAAQLLELARALGSTRSVPLDVLAGFDLGAQAALLGIPVGAAALRGFRFQ